MSEEDVTPKWWKYPKLGVRKSRDAGNFLYTKVNLHKDQIIIKEEMVKDITDIRLMDLYPASIGDKDINKVLKSNWFYHPNDENGYLIFAHISFINHCCVPNAYFNITKDKGKYTMTVRSYKHIKAGEAISISYVKFEKLMHNKKTRDSKLNNWFDSCKCVICREQPYLKKKDMEKLLEPLTKN
jgi:hypothetical protein